MTRPILAAVIDRHTGFLEAIEPMLEVRLDDGDVQWRCQGLHDPAAARGVVNPGRREDGQGQVDLASCLESLGGPVLVLGVIDVAEEAFDGEAFAVQFKAWLVDAWLPVESFDQIGDQMRVREIDVFKSLTQFTDAVRRFGHFAPGLNSFDELVARDGHPYE